MSEVCISIGSNYGNRRKNVEKAIVWLETLLKSLRKSDVYETPEVYGRGTPYYNCVVVGETLMPTEELNTIFKEYELSCGRDSEARRRGEVIIDIDIVVFENDVLRPVDFSRDFFKIGFNQIKG